MTTLTAVSQQFYDASNETLPAASRIIRVTSNTQLNNAIQDAQPGDRIVIANGSYNGLNLVGLKGTASKPIVFSAENPRQAMITGSASGRSARLSDCSYLEFHDIRFTGGSVWGFTIGPAYSTDTTLGCDNIRVIRCEIDNAGQVLLKVNGNSSNIDIIGNSLHDSGMSGYGKPYAEGIYVGDGNKMTDRSHDVLIQGNHLYNIGNQNNWGEGMDIKIQVYNITIVDNLIEHVIVNSQGAITALINDKDYPSNATNPNILIARNVIRDVSHRSGGWNGAGISAGSNGITVMNNVIWDTDEASITATQNASNTTGGFHVYNNTLGDGMQINLTSIGNANKPVAPVIMNNLVFEQGATANDRVATTADFIGPLTGDATGEGYVGFGFQLKESSAAVGSASNIDSVTEDLTGKLRPISGLSYGAFEANEAGYIPTYQTVTFDLTSGGYLNGTSEQRVLSGDDSESILAIPFEGYEFTGWTGDVVSSENPLILTDVTEDLLLTAVFTEVEIAPEDEQAPTTTIVKAINCAGSDYLSTDGILYSADAYYTSGQTAVRYSNINGTEDDSLYQSERYGAFNYAVPLPDGNYTVTLMFSETYWTSSSTRVFDVFVEEQRSIEDLDIYQEVGANAAYALSVPVYLRDGEINIELIASQDKAKLSAILIREGIDPSLIADKPYTVELIAGQNGSLEGELTQSIYEGGNTSSVLAIPDEGYRFTGWTGQITSGDNPLILDNVLDDFTATANFEPELTGSLVYAINCGGDTYLSNDGTLYSADRFYLEGVTGSKSNEIAETEDDPLYQTYRFNDVAYEFPIENGDYRVTLKFVEPYWNAAELRIFDILIEDEPIINDMDLFSLVGRNVSYDYTLDVTVEDGYLNIGSTASMDYSLIAAIQIEHLSNETVESSPSEESAAVDANNNGIADLLEQALNLDINNAATRLEQMPQASLTLDANKQYLELTFRRLKGGSGDASDGYTSNGIHYRVECSETLNGTWETGSDLLQVVGEPVDNGDGTESVTVRIKQAISESPCAFMRLNVSAI